MAYWARSFPGRPECVADVRRFMVKSLGDRPGVDVVELVASELTTNAVQHSESGRPGGQFTVHLAAFADRWRIRVDDAGGVGEPLPRMGEPEDDEAGRGLALVEALSSSWGVMGDHYARAVWAEVPIPREPEAEA